MEEDRDETPPAENASANASSSSAGGGKKGSPCEECGEQPWKYRCPGCARLPCSLPCVQAHKRCTSCTGKRPRTDPVPIAQFDDNQLISDYTFLEETKQARESAHRIIVGFGRNFGGQGGARPLSSTSVCSAAPNMAPLLWPRAWAYSSSAVPGINRVGKSSQESYNQRRLLVFSHGSILRMPAMW
ncbi:unnamed protein product [Urochloa humidicola]